MARLLLNRVVQQVRPVSITDAALTLKRVEASLSALPEVDAGRVETVRQQVDAGAYSINPENVADKLSQFESDFL